LLLESDLPDLGAALDATTELGSLSCRDMVAILQAQTQWRRSLLFFNWLRSSSFPLNAFVYNVMLKILRKAERWEIGAEIAEDMARRSPRIEPNNITYSTIISFAIRCGKPEEALRWFSRMRTSRCSPDSVTFASVIDVYVKSGRIDEAEELCSEMRRSIRPWDSVVHSQIVKLHGVREDWDQMWEAYKRMLDAGIAPNVVTLNSMISLLGSAGRSMQALRVFNDMLGLGLKPSPVTLSLMFRSFARSRHGEEALELYERIKAEDWAVDSVVYNSLLSLCAKLRRIEEGEMVYRELLSSKRCKPDDWTWRTMVDLYVKGGKVDEARKIAAEMMIRRGRAVVDLPVYMGLIQGYAKKHSFDLVVELFDELLIAGLPMDHMLAGAMLDALVQCWKAADRGGRDHRHRRQTSLIVDRIGLVFPELKILIEHLSDGNLSNANVSSKNLSIENASNENLTIENASSENLSSENASNENLSDGNLSSGENLSNADVSNENLSIDNVPSNENLSIENVSNVYLSDENLSEGDLAVAGTQTLVRGMLDRASANCRRPLINLLLDLCYAQRGVGGDGAAAADDDDDEENLHVQELLGIAISFGVYPDLQSRSATEWRLKLKLLSFGAARAALSGWISSLRDALNQDGVLPPSLSIEVGMGLEAPHGVDDDADADVDADADGDCSPAVMKSFVSKLLKAMDAPFGESKFGRLNASNKDVEAWLLSSEASSLPRQKASK
jgi:pentatricopeptide repeat protein